MPDIVISYRRSDAADIAGRIRDCLAREYGEGVVYMDVESIPSGADDYRDHIRNAIRGAKVILAVISPNWRGAKHGRTFRIFQQKDSVRTELEAALENRIPIIPVLVGGVGMLTEKDLPDSLKNLAYAQAATVTAGRDFHNQIEQLVRDIEKVLDQNGASSPASSLLRRRTRHIRKRIPYLSAIAAICIALFIAFWLQAASLQLSPKSSPELKYIPPSPRSHWRVGNSRVFLEASGPFRQFFFVHPSPELVAVGAEPGNLLFDGRRQGDRYGGRAYVFAGRCGKFSYDAEGDVLNDQRTVELKGKAPLIDSDLCKQTDWEEKRLVFDFIERK